MGGTDQFGGGSSCVHAGAPDQIFHLRVPGHQRALISARAAFVPMLFVIDGASCSVDCGRPAGTNGQSTGLAWYNSSPEATELYFVIDWTGGWPNPSSIPSSAPYSLDISFDSGAPEGESCLDPASLPTGVASLVSPGYGTNDEGPGQGVDHVYTVSVPARSKLEVSVASMGLGGALADVYFYARPGTCGTSSFDARQFANGMNPTSWVYENTSSSAVEVTILLESFGTSNLGALIVTPIVSAL